MYKTKFMLLNMKGKANSTYNSSKLQMYKTKVMLCKLKGRENSTHSMLRHQATHAERAYKAIQESPKIMHQGMQHELVLQKAYW